MGFRQKLKYELVHRLGYSNKAAQQLLESGRLQVGDKPVYENVLYDGISEIRLDDHVIKPAHLFSYYLFYKPRNVETTFSEEVPDGLMPLLPFYKQGLAYAGRLDKESEGLLILSDDGAFIEGLTNPSAFKDKEYIVEVAEVLTAGFIGQMIEGVEIMGQKTRPCEVYRIHEHAFRIILTEGRNRQIRRMCHKLGYTVCALKRIRIDRFELGALQPGEYRQISI